jgi:hypothetical protein
MVCRIGPNRTPAHLDRRPESRPRKPTREYLPPNRGPRTEGLEQGGLEQGGLEQGGLEQGGLEQGGLQEAMG